VLKTDVRHIEFLQPAAAHRRCGPTSPGFATQRFKIHIGFLYNLTLLTVSQVVRLAVPALNF